MRRRFIADTFTPATGHPTHAALTGEQAAHLARVLRAQPGQIYDIVANGFLHCAEITSVSDSEVAFILHEELEADAALPIHLLLAVFKFDHLEWAIEKATELGVARITPILARRTDQRPGRLAWWVWRDPEARGPYAIEPREQRLDAKGPVDPGQGHLPEAAQGGRPDLEFLLPQDQALIACIRENWRGHELNHEAALQALVGHPLVFWSEGEVDQAARMEVVAGQPELHVTRRGKVLELQLDPPLQEGDVMVQPEGLFRVRVITVTAAHRKLAEILGDGLCVPRGRGPGAPGPARRGPHGDRPLRRDRARTRPRARPAWPRWTATRASTSCSCRSTRGSRPSCGWSRWRAAATTCPGKAAPTSCWSGQGEMRLVARDLAGRAAAAEALLAALPTLPLDEGRSEWMIDDPESCMNLLLELEAAKGLAMVQWPEGGRLSPPRTLGWRP